MILFPNCRVPSVISLNAAVLALLHLVVDISAVGGVFLAKPVGRDYRRAVVGVLADEHTVAAVAVIFQHYVQLR